MDTSILASANFLNASSPYEMRHDNLANVM